MSSGVGATLSVRFSHNKLMIKSLFSSIIGKRHMYLMILLDEVISKLRLLIIVSAISVRAYDGRHSHFQVKVFRQSIARASCGNRSAVPSFRETA